MNGQVDIHGLWPGSKNLKKSLWLQKPPPKSYCTPCPSIITQPEWMEYSHYHQDMDQKARLQSSLDYGELFTNTDEEGLTDNQNHSLTCQVDFWLRLWALLFNWRVRKRRSLLVKEGGGYCRQKWNQDYQTDMNTYVKLLYSEDLDVASQISLLISLKRRINFFQHVDIFYKEILYYWANGQILSAKTSLMNLKCLIKSEMYICHTLLQLGESCEHSLCIHWTWAIVHWDLMEHI